MELCAFCRKSGEVARMVDNAVCQGEVQVKGRGMLPVDDEFGKPYARPCVHAVGTAGMVVRRDQGQTAIAGCEVR